MASGIKGPPFGGVRLPSRSEGKSFERSRRKKEISESESDSDTSERGYYNRSEDSEDDGGLPRVSTLKLGGRGETPARRGARVQSHRWAEGRGENPARREQRVESHNWAERRRETPARRQPTVIVVVATPVQLSPLGTTQAIGATEERYKVISNYATNSAGPDWDLKVTNVYEITPGVPAPTPPNKDPLDVLLWCKTTPTTVKYLAQQENESWVAFYDRIERAFPVTVDESGRDPLSQIIVLCSVAVGKPFKTDQGYHHWKNEQLPSGFDSVIARGQLQPDWEESREVNSVLVPCGKTREQKGHRRDFNLRFSEYLVNSASRIKPLYAVEITTTPKTV